MMKGVFCVLNTTRSFLLLALTVMIISSDCLKEFDAFESDL